MAMVANIFALPERLYMVMGWLKLPGRSFYWNNAIDVSLLTNTNRKNRFFMLRLAFLNNFEVPLQNQYRLFIGSIFYETVANISR